MTTDTAASPVQSYLDYVRFEKRLAQRTAANYAHGLHKLQQFAEPLALDLAQLQQTHIRRFAAQLHHAGHSSRDIALTLSTWRGFYTWLGRRGLCPHNPVQGVRAPRAARLLPKALSVDDAVRFAAYRGPQSSTHDNDAALQARDSAMTELLYSCGLRVGELVQLNCTAQAHLGQPVAYIDMQEGFAHVLGKGQKRRSVPVGQAALDAVRAWLVYRAANPRNAEQAALFTGQYGTRLRTATVWQRLKLRSMQVGLSQAVHPHMLRHSCASHVLQSSQDLRGVQELLGHQSIASTQVYTRLDFQHLAQVYDAAHPRAHSKTP